MASEMETGYVVFGLNTTHTGCLPIKEFVFEQMKALGLRYDEQSTETRVTYVRVWAPSNVLVEHAEAASVTIPRQVTEQSLTSKDRQTITLYLIRSIKAGPEGLKIGGIAFYPHDSVILKAIHHGVVACLFPLHHKAERDALYQSWVRPFISSQPLTHVVNYFGEHIAFYFAWAGFYTQWLVGPAMLGVLFFFLSPHPDSPLFLVYSAFLVVWSTVFIEVWKRRSNELAFEWRVPEFSEEASPRPEFYGELRVNPITDQLEPYYPPARRYVKYAITAPLVLLMVLCVLCVMLGFLWLERHCGGSTLTSLTISVVQWGVVLPVLDRLYRRAASALNDFENHRTQIDYNNHLVVKLVAFQVAYYNVSFFYLAFYKQDLARLQSQILTQMLMQWLAGNILETAVPYIVHKYRVRRERRHRRAMASSSSQAIQALPTALSFIEHQAQLSEYGGTFDDYLELVMQYGHLVLFSSAFPLAPLLALANNVIELRSDAFKLLYNCRRAAAERANGIGPWLQVLELLSFVGIITNLCLMAFTSQQLDMLFAWTPVEKLWAVVITEHVVIVVVVALKLLIPDVKQSVAIATAREKYQRRHRAKAI